MLSNALGAGEFSKKFGGRSWKASCMDKEVFY
jgi:hypothetical protein